MDKRAGVAGIFLSAIAVLGCVHLFAEVSTIAQAQQSSSAQCKTFPETGKMICGSFYSYWMRRGELAIFGYPISNSFTEKSGLDGKQYVVQYFERAVFELHPENPPPYDVLLAHLGTLRFRSSYQGGEPQVPYTDAPPAYPNAADVRTDYPQNSTTKIVTTFVTRDKAADVTSFYKEVFKKNMQWQLVNDEPTFLRFVTEHGIYEWNVVLVTSPMETSVRLRLNHHPIP